MTAVRVYVATTDGPSEIQRIADEDPEVRSVVCLNGTSEALPISGAYDAFVRKPTGVIERMFGHPVFRMDVAARISDGHSWQLGAFAAHALRAAGRLAQRNASASRAVWLTGTVDSDLRVGPVDHIAEKLQRSQPLFQKLLAEGVPITVFLPKANADQVPSPETGGGQPAGVDIVLVDNTDAVCRNLGLPRVARSAAAGRLKARNGKRRSLAFAAVVLLAAGSAGAVHWRVEIGDWLGSAGPTARPAENGAATVNQPPASDQVATPPTTTPATPTVPAVTPVAVVTPVPQADSSPAAVTPAAGSENPKPEAPTVADQTAATPDAAPAPEALPPSHLAVADIRLSAVEWRAPGGRSCAVAGFGSTGPTEVSIGTTTSGRFTVSSANGLCAVSYRVANGFAAPAHVWLFAAPMGVRKHFGASTSILESRVLEPGETAMVELKLPRWINEPVSHRIIVVATAESDAGTVDWLDQGMAAIETSFDFARWSDLRTRIQKNGMTLVSAIHEVVPQ